MDDGRKVWIVFIDRGDSTHIKIDFEAEEMNPAEMQQAGWKSILDSFKNYTETN